MIGVCEVSTAVLTAVSAFFSNIQKCLRTWGRTHFSVLNMKFNGLENQKNDQSPWGVDSCIS